MRCLISGGGTGGHLFPALAVAAELENRCQDMDIVFVGTSRQMDVQVLQNRGYAFCALRFSGVKGLGARGLGRALWSLIPALLKARGIMRHFRPDLVFTVGGYVTVPVVLAARWQGIPICIHEQNSVPGLANRVAGRVASTVCLSLPCPEGFAKRKTVLTGNPVRHEILEAARGLPDRKDRHETTLLVLGGSQGAHAINTLMLDAAPRIVKGKKNVRIIHQTGTRDLEEVRRVYAERGIGAEVRAFSSDMPDWYRKADLVVSRAGATTLAELAIMGLPAILIPYPHAADDHQTVNAAYYVRRGGALLAPERELNGEQLARMVKDLLADRNRLDAMGNAMRSCSHPEAATAVADICLGLATGVRSGSRTPTDRKQSHV